ncbi:Oxalate-binding protein [BD1-7 clade bacterium]|uniref:Oxalate-binding protein n=1 Tax=BD1-7 clade bacterium TaxID=2029982 RepID=A0A5S9PQU0_9GAMM|nr:Oxalate-binding protein [BD1-7 clade bacterium]
MKKLNIYADSTEAINGTDNTQWSALFDHEPLANVARIRLQPGIVQDRHFHRNGADIFIIIEGQGRLIYGDVSTKTEALVEEKSLEVARGDVYFIDPFQMHALENTGKNDLVWLNIAPGDHADIDCVYMR